MSIHEMSHELLHHHFQNIINETGEGTFADWDPLMHAAALKLPREIYHDGCLRVMYFIAQVRCQQNC